MTGTIPAGIYTRMSLAAMDDTTKTDDQERIGRELAARRGDLAVVAVYCDNNKSAWQRGRKRPGWDRMLADIEAGRISAVIVYHGDRLIRQPRDLEVLLSLAESRGIRLYSPTGTRNLDSADDRFILRIEAAQACRESDNTSRRKKAEYDRLRREGRVRPGGPGGRSFGYRTDNLTPVPAELDLVREAAGRLLAGESQRSVCRDWNARGLRTTAGGEWRTGNLGPMLALPRYAGLMPDGESRAAWEPALDQETWERLRLVIKSRAAANPSPGNARRWMLSGIAACGPCGAALQIGLAAGGRAAWSYTCARTGCGRIRRSAVHLDAYVSGRVVARLNDPRNPGGRPPGADHAAEWTALAAERDEADALLKDYKASAGRARSLMERLDAIDARIAELRELADTTARDRLLSQYQGITLAEFLAQPLDVRRSLVAATVTVTVLPATRRGPGFRTEDVRVERVG